MASPPTLDSCGRSIKRSTADQSSFGEVHRNFEVSQLAAPSRHVDDPDLGAVVGDPSTNLRTEEPARLASGGAPLIDIVELAGPAHDAAGADLHLLGNLGDQLVSSALVGGRRRPSAPGTLNHVSVGVFAFCSHRETSENARGPRR